MAGYCGTILRVNLSTSEIKKEELGSDPTGDTVAIFPAVGGG